MHMKKKRAKEVKGIKVPQSGTASHVLFPPSPAPPPGQDLTTYDLRTLRPAIPKTSLTPILQDVPAAI